MQNQKRYVATVDGEIMEINKGFMSGLLITSLNFSNENWLKNIDLLNLDEKTTSMLMEKVGEYPNTVVPKKELAKIAHKVLTLNYKK